MPPLNERAERDPITSFDCLIDYFTADFSNDVDVIFLVMNQSRGEFLERSTRDVISNFTASQRIFESGEVAGIPRKPLTPYLRFPRKRSPLAPSTLNMILGNKIPNRA